LVVALAIAGAGFGFWVHQNGQARQFVAATIPIVYTEWNADALTHRYASELQTPDFEAQVRDKFQLLAPHLGPLESTELPEGALRYGRPHPKLAPGLFGTFTARAKFRDGEATLDFLVLKEQGTWRIGEFGVESPALMEAMQRQAARKNTRPNYERGPPEEEAAVLAAAEEILRIMDSEDPGAAWNRGSLPFQKAITKRRFVADMKRMHDKSGHAQKRELQGVGFMFNRTSANPPGDYAIADYVSTYSRATLRERLGFYRREGVWRFSAHSWDRVDKK
jgi:hypothetical protein